jgi:hypothetical protein
MTEDWAPRSNWDERIRILASQLRALARSFPSLATEARQLAHSIEELSGLEGLVSEDYVSGLFSRARGLASVVQLGSAGSGFPRTPSSARTVRAPVVHPACDEDDVPTSPGTPRALRRTLHSPVLTAAPPIAGPLVGNDSEPPRPEEPPGSGVRPTLNGRKDTTLRLKTG